MECEKCGKPLTGQISVSEGMLDVGVPIVSLDSTPHRNWICCDGCNALLCRGCCSAPGSGYCDDCIEKYDMRADLWERGLIRENGDVSS